MGQVLGAELRGGAKHAALGFAPAGRTFERELVHRQRLDPVAGRFRDDRPCLVDVDPVRMPFRQHFEQIGRRTVPALVRQAQCQPDAAFHPVGVPADRLQEQAARQVEALHFACGAGNRLQHVRRRAAQVGRVRCRHRIGVPASPAEHDQVVVQMTPVAAVGAGEPFERGQRRGKVAATRLRHGFRVLVAARKQRRSHDQRGDHRDGQRFHVESGALFST